MDYLPLSKVNTLAYCERRFHLEYVLGELHTNHHVVEGHYLHKRAYTESDELSGLWVWSDRLGLVGVVDRLEWRKGGAAVVEYKVGRASKEAHHSDAVQLAAQALCLLESRGIEAKQGFIYYHKSHVRREVTFTPELFLAVEEAVARMRVLQGSPRPPGVEVPRCKCEGCSVREVCQPELWRKGVAG
ncbi:MAG: CRISPR-associated protein Cas4 [Meiothermus sp.]|uniref:CRISPR-associated protein Cas4 n=1 Tax=Meiothermus sp. TaxID=1955249 RepID=UPI00260D09FE|nr:CRISPR-associated protein Cas4 [Meiothermus sp.]MCS7059433.1 CRISPR-associated protein Cas4 [Meiothermus sp.]